MFGKFIQVKVKPLKLRREKSEKLISQRDFLHEKIFIFESDCDGKLKLHDRLTEENVCVLTVRKSLKSQTVTIHVLIKYLLKQNVLEYH